MADILTEDEINALLECVLDEDEFDDTNSIAGDLERIRYLFINGECTGDLYSDKITYSKETIKSIITILNDVEGRLLEIQDKQSKQEN